MQREIGFLAYWRNLAAARSQPEMTMGEAMATLAAYRAAYPALFEFYKGTERGAPYHGGRYRKD